MIVLSKERITKAVITTKSGFLTPHRKSVALQMALRLFVEGWVLRLVLKEPESFMS